MEKKTNKGLLITSMALASAAIALLVGYNKEEIKKTGKNIKKEIKEFFDKKQQK